MATQGKLFKKGSAAKKTTGKSPSKATGTTSSKLAGKSKAEPTKSNAKPASKTIEKTAGNTRLAVKTVGGKKDTNGKNGSRGKAGQQEADQKSTKVKNLTCSIYTQDATFTVDAVSQFSPFGGTRKVDMSDKITVRGARQHNLKNIGLDIPKNKLVVVRQILAGFRHHFCRGTKKIRRVSVGICAAIPWST
jgi:hypothetical protein